MKDRALALAALLQALEAVTRLARQGQVPQELAEPLIASAFRIDADSTEAVYGGAAHLRVGLQLLAAHAGGQPGSSAPLARMGMNVLQVERSLAARQEMLRGLGRGIEDLAQASGHLPMLDPARLSGLGELYAQTISKLTPRVMVQGEPTVLSRSDVVLQIRALLMAAVRAAVLWRQLGGSYWDFFLRRGAIAEAARRWLRTIES
ncbi:MAG: high frequency lysogenization protein HflD [Xanthomonadales bacterium]|nr:high frequency lysogenization protein HflD [Xanthomonadales bacterium]